MDNQNKAEVFTRAAEALEKYGLIAGVWGDKTRGFCALGVIGYAVNGQSYEVEMEYLHPYINALSEALNLQPQADKYNMLSPDDHRLLEANYKVAAWSNNLVAAGLQGEVIAGFRRAAAHYETHLP